MTEPARMTEPHPFFTISEGRQTIAPADASRILALAPYDGQRPIHQDHVEKWAYMMTQRVFLANQGISFAYINGTFKLINGQHRLSAVIRSGMPQTFDVTIYPCATDEEVRVLYARFDTEALGRSTLDMIAHDPVVSKDFPAQYLARLVEVMSIIDLGFKNIGPRKVPATARLKENRLAKAQDWIKEATLYRSLSKGRAATKVHAFYNGYPLAIAIVTLRHQPEQATDFWRRAIQNDGLHIGDPARAMLDAWDRKSVKWTRYQRGHIAALAWNAAFQQERVQLIRPPKEDLWIAGTPY